MRNPWKKLSSRIAYENPWIRVREDSVVRPDGTKGIYSFVEFSGPGTVCVLPVSLPYVYLAKGWNYPLGKFRVDAIGGFVDKGESFLAAAKRELREEISLRAVRWVDLGMTHESAGVTKDLKRSYLAIGVRPVAGARDRNEPMRTKKVRLSTLHKAVLAGEVEHLPTAYVILRAWEYFQARKTS